MESHRAILTSLDITPGRVRVSLDGPWACRVLARTELHGDGSLHEDVADLPDVAQLPVPCNWHHAGLPGLHGRVELRRELPARDGDGWWLCFGGVDYFCDVLIDGVPVLSHEGAFDPFEVAVPRDAREVRLVIDAPREEFGTLWPYRKRQLKGILTQWDPLEPFAETTGGPWGSIWLEQRPDAHLTAVRTSTFLVPRPAIEDGAYVATEQRDARVEVDVSAWSATAGRTEIIAELCGVTARRSVDLPVGSSLHRLVMTVRDPELWWPWDRGEPRRHELRMRLGADEVRRRIGLRETSFDDQSGVLTCNGERVALRGSNAIPEKWLSLYGAARAAADVELILRAGLNAVRLPVHVAPDVFYDACDEAGILVWQDMPLQWDHLIDDEVIRQAAEQAARIVLRLHDHPSIALWCAHNEPFPANRENFAGPLLRAVRAVDGSRPLHAASDFAEHAYPGWFAGSASDFALPAPLGYVTEFGALALPSADEARALGATGWPPQGAAWSQVLPEQAPLFDVAGVSLGDSLDDLVEASQRYQAEVVQTGVESYRSRGMSVFHFALMDGWPATSWAVVSYGRVPKLAYAALCTACQPILVGAELSRRTLSDAADTWRFPLLAGIWVVNDTREDLRGCSWTAHLGGHELQRGTLDVPADGIARWRPPWQRWPAWQPPALEPGMHHLELVLSDREGVVRSRNRYTITVVRRGLEVPLPR